MDRPYSSLRAKRFNIEEAIGRARERENQRAVRVRPGFAGAVNPFSGSTDFEATNAFLPGNLRAKPPSPAFAPTTPSPAYYPRPMVSIPSEMQILAETPATSDFRSNVRKSPPLSSRLEDLESNPPTTPSRDVGVPIRAPKLQSLTRLFRLLLIIVGVLFLVYLGYTCACNRPFDPLADLRAWWKCSNGERSLAGGSATLLVSEHTTPTPKVAASTPSIPSEDLPSNSLASAAPTSASRRPVAAAPSQQTVPPRVAHTRQVVQPTLHRPPRPLQPQPTGQGQRPPQKIGQDQRPQKRGRTGSEYSDSDDLRGAESDASVTEIDHRSEASRKRAAATLKRTGATGPQTGQGLIHVLSESESSSDSDSDSETEGTAEEQQKFPVQPLASSGQMDDKPDQAILTTGVTRPLTADSPARRVFRWIMFPFV